MSYNLSGSVSDPNEKPPVAGAIGSFAILMSLFVLYVLLKRRVESE